ncbi:MAG TPA: ATP-binding cassette domain-containing protein [Oligoflexus sp.]|uniref:ABC transporter ATP-binding protein n=1 Tax=Oligoflexus sp. TaxID=1971216 RepID=UPI002D50B28D|nr:ATP-binding cassette domain-containing protein [Oligoflexus sp.]HYX36990.1 ATP-binding cassette domain-containing protein [Oligoflexus sp.]
MSHLLQVRDLAYQTPDHRPLIERLSFDLNLGDLLVITGPNGIGKSTLLQILLGQARQAQGTIGWQLPMSRVGFLSQLHNREFHISLTLADIVSFANAVEPGLIQERSHGLLHASQLNLAWNTASGGERQKTLLTRVFLKDPSVLILDEPMNHLDAISRQQLLTALRHFIADGQHAVIMVGHESSWDPLEWNPHRTIDLKGYVVP